MNKQQELEAITLEIERRSKETRKLFEDRCNQANSQGLQRQALSCTNLAHAVAAVPANDKLVLHAERQPNLAIVTSYNDMLSAHQPFKDYPDIIKAAVRQQGATAQVAGGVPAMCDGVTQGQPGMELSLFSRDSIAQTTAIALSHNMFDAAVYLGVCDKIVPGLLIGALSFGHLPAVFVPAGPMTTGLSNKDKARTRQRFAEGKASREELLQSESASYHGPGTCTFYGTANSNQMLMEFMGLHLPGAAFINPGTEIREALTAAAAQRAIAISQAGKDTFTPLYEVVTAKSIINALVGLMATGGSTNHTLHLVAIARAAGLIVNWDDFARIGNIVPLLTHVYPSGKADVNQFHAAGGLALVIHELLQAGLLHEDVKTVAGDGGLRRYTEEPYLSREKLEWRAGTTKSLDPEIISTTASPFLSDGGLILLQGNLGRAVAKVSAVREEHRVVNAPARVFTSQQQLVDAFDRDELNLDFVAVIRQQGPHANGMPELHRLTPILGVLLDRGHKVALVTDGRMSGASGKVPAAIHVSPESALGGALGKVRDGDQILLDCDRGIVEAQVDEAEWSERLADDEVDNDSSYGFGRELFANFRRVVTNAEQGASSLYPPLPND